MKINRSDKDSVKKILRTLASVCAVVAAVTGLSFGLALHYGFDAVIGHFDSTVWFYIFAGGIALSAVISAVCAFACRGYGFSAGFAKIPSPLCYPVAALALFRFALFLKNVFVDHMVFSTLEKIAGILTVFVAVAFILSATEKTNHSPLTCAMFILSALAVNFDIFASYFDFSIPVNSPIRHVTTIMQCAVLLFMIAEARLGLPEKSGRSTAYFAAFVYMFTFAVCSFMAIAGAVHKLTGGEAPLDSVRLLMYFFISVVSFIRFMSVPGNLCDLPEKENKSTEKNK